MLAILGIGMGTGVWLGRFLPSGAVASPVGATTASAGRISFNQHFVEGFASKLNLDDPKAVFQFVFSALPSQVQVHPTENYYYFSFTAAGRYLFGNLRLGPDDRDKGVLHFAYFVHGASDVWDYRALDKDDGVVVKRKAKLSYDVVFKNKSVRFNLNPISQSPPEGYRFLPGEQFVGRCQDESGFRLLLIYSRSKKHFLFALDEEQGVPWHFVRMGKSILLHPSSGFAFYDDLEGKRKVLIGVAVQNIELNNYFDGPFDQLPDNFLAETPFSVFVEEAYPYAKGHIDAYGKFMTRGQKGRMALTPYNEYRSVAELVKSVEQAQASSRTPAGLYARLCYDDKTEYPAETLSKPSVYGRAVLKGRVDGGR